MSRLFRKNSTKQRKEGTGNGWFFAFLVILAFMAFGSSSAVLPATDVVSSTVASTEYVSPDTLDDSSELAFTETQQGEDAVTAGEQQTSNDDGKFTRKTIKLSSIPAYSGAAFVAIDDNKPSFTNRDKKRKAGYEKYSAFDNLGRCGTAFAMVGPETMPTAPRDSIGEVFPSGWQISKYAWIEGKYLYNRCHLIGYQLSGENANARNLITGTRYLNVEGMESFENEVASYVERTGNHVAYRSTPVFKKQELIARGVLLEAWSVEDKGKGVQFCVYCYNVQPGVTITYKDGSNKADGTMSEASTLNLQGYDFILNTNSKKFHRPACSAVESMSEKNKRGYKGTREELIEQGYDPCNICKP